MTNRQTASRHVKDGLAPSVVAERMGTKAWTVRQYLLQQIAEGELLGTDVLRSFSNATKDAFEDYIRRSEFQDYWTLVNACNGEEFESVDFQIYLDCRNSVRKDLYGLMSDLEVFLHDTIREALVACYGETETGWWRQGIPPKIRVDCVTSREVDPYAPGDPYVYTTFIHLSNIIENNWSVFSSRLPKEFASNKRLLIQTLNRLNTVRNAVMHPVKKIDFSDDDFDFVRKACESLGNPRAWRDGTV